MPKAKVSDSKTAGKVLEKVADKMDKIDSKKGAKETDKIDKVAKVAKAALPELAAMVDDCADAEEAIMLLERAMELKITIGKDPDKKKGTPGTGLLGELYEVKEQLSTIMMVNELPGLRHNKLVFVDRWQDGKEGLDKAVLRQELALAGVDLEVINKAFEQAKKTGDGYFVRTLEEID